MQFAQPAGLWLGLAGALVLLAYLVRRRARRVDVPFLGLWTGALSERRGGFGSAITRRVDLLLALLACAAVALAAGAPFVPGTPSTVRDLVLVLDGGVEMRAEGRTERLVRIAEAEVRSRAQGARFLLVRVEPGGPLLYTGTSVRDALAFVRAARGGWQRVSAAAGLELALVGAEGLTHPDLVFCTYRPGRPDGFRLRTVPSTSTNAGFSSLEVVGDPEGGARLARVRLRGTGPAEIEGHWKGQLEDAGVLDLSLPVSGELSLTVRAAGDVFSPDDTIYLRLPDRKLPRVLVVAENDPSAFLISAMLALEETQSIRGPLDRTTPDRVAEAWDAYDVVVFDRCAPKKRWPGMRALFLAPEGGALPFRLGALADAPALFDVKTDHPVLAGTAIDQLPPVRARSIRGGEALAVSAPGPVIAIGPGWIALGYDPEKCVLASSPAYPLFLRNCISQLAGGGSARVSEFARIGERTQREGVARRPDGHRVRLEREWSGPPGFWEFEKNRIAVNFVESNLDLTPTDELSDPLVAVGRPAVPDHALVPAFGAAALLLLLVGWWWFWR